MTLEDFLKLCTLDGYGHLIVPVELYVQITGLLPSHIEEGAKDELSGSSNETS